MEWSPQDRSPAANYHWLTSAVAPRPIAWVTTVDEGGLVNAAPFSWFQSVCADPQTLLLSIGDRAGQPKDTLRNIQATGEFVVNIATLDLVDAIVASSADYPAGTSEVDALGLETAPSHVVAPPRLAASPVHMECRLDHTHRIGDELPVTLVLGRVVWVHAKDEVLDERGNVDPRVPFLARLGGKHYTHVAKTFTMERPTLDRQDS